MNKEHTVEDIVREVNKVTKQFTGPDFTPTYIESIVVSVNTVAKTMLDTGSSISLLKETFRQNINRKAKRLGISTVELDNSKVNSLVGIGEQGVAILGETIVIIQLGPLIIPLEVLVIENVPVDILVGTPEIARWGLVLDIWNKIVTFTSHPGAYVNIKCISYHPYMHRAVTLGSTRLSARH